MIQSVLGFDFGEKRIGIATGQTITRSASPLTTLVAVNNKPDWSGIEKLIQQWKPDALIVGMPLLLDGTKTEITAKVERFCRYLSSCGLPPASIPKH